MGDPQDQQIGLITGSRGRDDGGHLGRQGADEGAFGGDTHVPQRGDRLVEDRLGFRVGLQRDHGSELGCGGNDVQNADRGPSEPGQLTDRTYRGSGVPDWNRRQRECDGTRACEPLSNVGEHQRGRASWRGGASPAGEVRRPATAAAARRFRGSN